MSDRCPHASLSRSLPLLHGTICSTPFSTHLLGGDLQVEGGQGGGGDGGDALRRRLRGGGGGGGGVGRHVHALFLVGGVGAHAAVALHGRDGPGIGGGSGGGGGGAGRQLGAAQRGGLAALAGLLGHVGACRGGREGEGRAWATRFGGPHLRACKRAPHCACRGKQPPHVPSKSA